MFSALLDLFACQHLCQLLRKASLYVLNPAGNIQFSHIQTTYQKDKHYEDHRNS